MPPRGGRGREDRGATSGGRRDPSLTNSDPPLLRSGRPARRSEVPDSWRELERAHLLLRRAAAGLDRRASDHGWPVPFSPIRFLVLARIHGASAFGIRPRRLARELSLKGSSLAYHLDALEEAELVHRRRRRVGHDGRRVAVRLTELGVGALWVLDRAVREAVAARREVVGEATPR